MTFFFFFLQDSRHSYKPFLLCNSTCILRPLRFLAIHGLIYSNSYMFLCFFVGEVDIHTKLFVMQQYMYPQTPPISGNSGFNLLKLLHVSLFFCGGSRHSYKTFCYTTVHVSSDPPISGNSGFNLLKLLHVSLR